MLSSETLSKLGSVAYQATTTSELNAVDIRNEYGNQPVALSLIAQEIEKPEEIGIIEGRQEIHLLGNSAQNKIIAEYAVKAAVEGRHKRIALYNFSISDLERLLDVRNKNTDQLFSTFFDFMTPITDENGQDLSFAEVYQQMDEWSRSDAKHYQYVTNIAFTGYEAREDIAKSFNPNERFPTWLDLCIREESTGNRLPQAMIERGQVQVVGDGYLR